MSVRPHPLQQTDQRYDKAWIIDYKTQDGRRRQEVFDGPLADAEQYNPNKTAKQLFMHALMEGRILSGDYPTI